MVRRHRTIIISYIHHYHTITFRCGTYVLCAYLSHHSILFHLRSRCPDSKKKGRENHMQMRMLYANPEFSIHKLPATRRNVRKAWVYTRTDRSYSCIFSGSGTTLGFPPLGWKTYHTVRAFVFLSAVFLFLSKKNHDETLQTKTTITHDSLSLSI